jgi:hypothetical protein
LVKDLILLRPISDADQDGWDESDWGWQDEEEEQMEDEEDDVQHSWLQDSFVSLSPAAELMAIARDDKLVLLGCQSFQTLFM